MAQDKKVPLSFWIGLHKDGSGRQCMVDTIGGSMEGVKAAWDAENPNAVTVMETVIRPELTPDSDRLLGLMLDLEKRLGGPTAPGVHQLLREIASAAYDSGLQHGALLREVKRG